MDVFCDLPETCVAKDWFHALDALVDHSQPVTAASRAKFRPTHGRDTTSSHVHLDASEDVLTIELL